MSKLPRMTAVAFVIFTQSCAAPTRPSGQASLAFWTDAASGWNSISIKVDGQSVGTLTAYRTSTPSCTASAGTVVANVSKGSHSYVATTDSGGTWENTVNVTNDCQTLKLTCPNGNCGGSGGGGGGGSTQCTVSVSGVSNGGVIYMVGGEQRTFQVTSTGNCGWTASMTVSTFKFGMQWQNYDGRNGTITVWIAAGAVHEWCGENGKTVTISSATTPFDRLFSFYFGLNGPGCNQ